MKIKTGDIFSTHMKTTEKKFITSENIGKLSCWISLTFPLLQTLSLFPHSKWWGHMHFHFITHGTNERALWWCSGWWRRRGERRGGLEIFIYETEDSLHFVPHSFRTLTSTSVVLVNWLFSLSLSVSPFISHMEMWAAEFVHVNRQFNLFAHFHVSPHSDFFLCFLAESRLHLCDVWFLF